MTFQQIKSGYQVCSLVGMLKKVKWCVLEPLFKRYDIKYSSSQSFQANKKRMIKELINKLPVHKKRKLLTQLKDEHIQPSQLTKFIQNRKNAIDNNLIRYE